MRRYSVLITGVVVAVVCVRLGFWQLDRWSQRKTQNHLLEERRKLPALDLVSVADSVPWDSLHFRRAEASGVYDFQREVVVVGRSVQGRPGVYLATPLLLSDGRAVLVERGWVYSADARTVNPELFREAPSARVSGLLLRPGASRGFDLKESSWPIFTASDDPLVLGRAYPYRLLGVVLRRGAGAEGASPQLQPVPLPQLGSGPHLSYAVQWFSFGLIALVGSLALYVRWSYGRDA